MSATNFQEEKVQSKITIIQLFLGLWPFVKKHSWLLFGAVTFTLIHILSARLLPVTIGFAIDKGVIGKDLNIFLQAALFYSILQFTFTGSQFLYTLFFAKLGNKSLFELREQLFTHVQGLPLSYFHKNPTGRLVNRLTYDPNNLQEIFTEGLINLIIQIGVLLSIVASMLVISWTITLIALISVPFFIYLSIKVTQRMRLHQRAAKQQIGAISAFITERLQGLSTLQVLNVLPRTFQNFVVLSDQYKRITLNVIKSGATLHPVLNMATAIIISSLLMVSGYFSAQDSLSLGAITTLLLHAQDFIPPLREILERYQQFQNSLTSAERVFPIFTEIPESSRFRSAELSPDLKPPGPTGLGKIEFINVDFRYSEAGSKILNQINLLIQPGEKIALVGKTGAGKSTLTSLLQGFYLPTAGEIKIDSQNITNYPLGIIRQKIGAIQQDPFVFRGTLKDNLSVGSPDFSDDQINHVLTKLGILDYFKSRGMDLDFWIQEKGQNISLGERQLINFVRIFLFNPPILVFDEATSNMDSETELALQVALKSLLKNRTTIMIAHRLSTLKDCSRIYLLSNGTLTLTSLAAIEADPSLLS
jgi:ATP-binding cassette subfamily B protein